MATGNPNDRFGINNISGPEIRTKERPGGYRQAEQLIRPEIIRYKNSTSSINFSRLLFIFIADLSNAVFIIVTSPFLFIILNM